MQIVVVLPNFALFSFTHRGSTSMFFFYQDIKTISSFVLKEKNMKRRNDDDDKESVVALWIWVIAVLLCMVLMRLGNNTSNFAVAFVSSPHW